MWGAVAAARDKALDEGEAEAEKKLERVNDSRGYNLPTEIEQETTGHQSGRIYYEPFYGRWFEYGTTHIAAYPFMRPAHRKMRKRFVDELGEEAPKWIRRKAGMR
jgi:HK97 gp10 family phage protein